MRFPPLFLHNMKKVLLFIVYCVYRLLISKGPRPANKETAMIKPTININGTSKDELINPRRDAIDALASIIETLKLVTPNGRDYPRDLSQCVADRDKHYARLNQLRDIQYELLQEALYIQREA